MTRTVTDLYRYPIKSHGCESVAQVLLEAGKMLPWDRIWAVAHEKSEADGATWVPCQNFSIGSKTAELGAISSRLDENTSQVTLSHPKRDDLTFSPDTEGDKLIAWTMGLVPEHRAQPARVVRARTDAFSDSDFQSVTLCNLASHRAVEDKLGHTLSRQRWRGNIWFEGETAWEEFDWLDRDVQIGEAVLRVRERTDRCLATHNNPETGQRDAHVLGTLDRFGHRDFSVRAEVIKGGCVCPGDKVTPL
ncbi:MOSC domain-containing protein [Pacificoceanicola onchidii]|uniref:MOSC domain-containing protein n=1 Tax=Pacificoceanicola onchidii TaxID=2562685 RepID=UPI0010A502DB|nr:MOSC N-terminal beta barrel domain-containing protein [Pacificoceanicola onchidii]